MPRRTHNARPYELLGPEAYKAFLAVLREDGRREYGLHGWREIGEWLTRMQFVKRTPIDVTLRRWRDQFCMPVTRARRASDNGRGYVPFSTNLCMHAWLATQSRAMSLPRWHPFRQAVAQIALSQKPSAVRMRRHRLSKIVASRASSSSRPSGAPPASPSNERGSPAGA